MYRYFLLALVLSYGFAAELEPPRIGEHPGYTRVVLDLPAGATYQLDPLGAALRLVLPGQTLAPGLTFVSRPELAGYVQEQFPDRAQIIFFTPQSVSPRSGFKFQLLPALEGEGQRLVIDLSGAFVDTSPLPSLPSFSFVKNSGRRFSVVVDAGHGGPDPGAVALVTEKVVNLDVARRVAGYLQASGVEVTMTRQDDTAFSPDKRTDLTQRVALAEGKSLYVSIHVNAAPASRINSWCGLEVFYYGPGSARILYPAPAPLLPGPAVAAAPVASYDLTPDMLTPTDPSAVSSPEEPLPPSVLPTPTPQMNSARRTELSRKLGARVMSYLLGSTAALNRGVRPNDFFVIRYNTVPAILVEMGYGTHPLEGLNLRDDNYLERIAYGVARGVLEYLENDQPAE